MSKGWKTFAIWCTLISLFFVFYSLFSRKDHELSWRDAAAFRAEIDAGEIESVTPERGSLTVKRHDGDQYRVSAVLDEPTWRNMTSHGVRLAPRTVSESSTWSSFLVSWVPLLLLVLFFVFLLRRMGGAQNMFALRKTTARLVAKPPAVTFADVGGAAEAEQRLADVIDFLRRPRVWKKAGARLPHGVLLEGPPGCGKTLLARAVAGEAKVPFFEVSASEFVEMFVGVGSARVRDLFEQAAKKVPAVVFIDELDAVGRAARRGRGAQPRTSGARTDAQPAAGEPRRLPEAQGRRRARRHQPCGHPRCRAAPAGALRHPLADAAAHGREPRAGAADPPQGQAARARASIPEPSRGRPKATAARSSSTS